MVGPPESSTQSIEAPEALSSPPVADDSVDAVRQDGQPNYGLGLCVRAAVACLVAALAGALAILILHPDAPGSHESVVAAIGLAGGVGIVVTSFVMSSLVIAWADIVDRKMILPMGLMTYALKIVVIGLVVFALARKEWAGFYPLLWGIALGAATWTIAQAWWTFQWARNQPAVPFVPKEPEENSPKGTKSHDPES